MTYVYIHGKNERHSLLSFPEAYSLIDATPTTISSSKHYPQPVTVIFGIQLYAHPNTNRFDSNSYPENPFLTKP